MFSKIHKGTRWKIVFGSYSGVEKFAIEELQRTVQSYLPYVVEVYPANNCQNPDDSNLLIVGRPNNNVFVDQAIQNDLLALDDTKENFAILSTTSPCAPDKKAIYLTANDANGVLYAVEEFNLFLCNKRPITDCKETNRSNLDGIRPFSIKESPAIQMRGIWTWGYVMYDYRCFIDNMARLKMNTLTVWNDCVPLNIDEITEYAHSRGVKLILGFEWGWGMDWDGRGIEITNAENRQMIKQHVLKNYNENYRNLSIDGIYFQTLTEHNKTEIDNISVATAACELVNDIAKELFTDKPELYLQFGLHAISILENYSDLVELDPRVTIAWEDAGLIPYSYNPVTSQQDAGFTKPDGLDTIEKTIEYSKKLVNFRENREFAMVPKGWITLPWKEEFENHGPFILGCRSSDYIKKRLQQRKDRWEEVEALWKENYGLAQDFYQQILKCKPKSMAVTGLIEDGMFEEKIQPSVVMFADMLWNPYRDGDELLARSASSYYKLL